MSLIDALNKMTITKSSEEYTSIDKGFFMTDGDMSKFVDTNHDANEELRTILDTELSFLHESMKYAYSYFNNLNNEIYANNWTFFSVKTILDRYNTCKADNVYTIDIALKYFGMGWIRIMFYDPILNTFNIRDDGGSNGFDREINYNNLKEYCDKKSTKTGIIIKSFNTLEEFIDFIITVTNDFL